MDPILNELHEAAVAVTVPIRMAKGLDRLALERLKAVLVRAAEAWADTDSLPKAAAASFVDLAPVMESCSYAYPDENERRAILHAANEVDTLVRKCLAKPVEAAGSPI